MIENFAEKVTYYEESLDSESKSFVHFRSIKNFILYYDKLTKNHQKIALQYFERYFAMLAQNLDFDWDSSNTLYWDCVQPLAIMYRVDLRFKSRKVLGYQIVYGLILDAILYLAGLSRLFYYLPMGTVLFLLDWSYTKLRYYPQGKVYGPGY
jgi:hypothetical protein